jgi:hypothetical protein
MRLKENETYEAQSVWGINDLHLTYRDQTAGGLEA